MLIEMQMWRYCHDERLRRTMNEPCPKHLDDDGKSLWEQCEWILNGGSTNPSIAFQLQALAIRRELRLESQTVRAYKEFAFSIRDIARRIGIARTSESIKEELEKLAEKYEHWSHH